MMVKKEFVKYALKPQSDGSYLLLQKDLTNGKVDIHSQYDNLEEAQDALDDLRTKPSPMDFKKFFQDFQTKIQNK